MKDSTSNSSKINFKEFPGNKKTEKSQKKPFKTKLLILLVGIILCVLFIFSSILNEKLLYEKDSSNYKIVNKYKGSFAVVNEKDRNDLLKKIGFDKSLMETKVRNNKNYITTYAYHINNNDTNQVDSLSVYYDKDNVVNYVSLNLIYDVDGFSVATAREDANTILNNFALVDIKYIAIKKALKDDYYQNGKDVKVIYKISKINNDKYYMLNIIVKK